MLGPMSHAWWMASSVFDGARSIARLVPDLDRHCARIIESGKAFGMTAPLTADEIIALAEEARQKGFGTAVVLDAMGNVAEFATNNLFIVRDGTVQTPAANGAFLLGLTRRRVMELLTDDGYDVAEITLTLADLAAADEVFLTGNYSKVQPVIQVADTHYQIGPVAKRARELYFEFAEREGGRKI
jgi:branched-subunit amino acid aminotransferase/4-amino-4-deoxychorismate lyase